MPGLLDFGLPPIGISAQGGVDAPPPLMGNGFPVAPIRQPAPLPVSRPPVPPSVPSSSGQPSILDRILGRLYPTTPYDGLLDPAMLKSLRDEQVTRTGLGLLAASGPRPQGTSSAISDIGNVLSQQSDSWSNRLQGAVQNAMAIQQLQRTLEGRQQIQSVLNKYPAPDKESDLQRRQRWGNIVQGLIGLGSPEALQFLEHAGPVVKDIVGPILTPSEALAQQKEGNVIDARRQAYDLGKTEGWVGKDEPFQPGRDYVAERQHWVEPVATHERGAPGMPARNITRTKAGTVLSNTVDLTDTTPPPEAWTRAATGGAAAIASWRDVDKIRQLHPDVEQKVADAMSTKQMTNLIPFLGSDRRGEAMQLIQTANLPDYAKQYLTSKIAFLDNIVATKIPGGRLAGPLLDQYKTVLVPSIGTSFDQMRKNELREIIAARGRSGFHANPQWWNQALEDQGVGGFDPQSEMATGTVKTKSGRTY